MIQRDRALGADPLKKLVWPRLVASTLVMPVLAAFALVLGFGGAMMISDVEFGIPVASSFCVGAGRRDDGWAYFEWHDEDAGVWRDHRTRWLSLRHDDSWRHRRCR